MSQLELIRERLATLQPIRIELEDDGARHAGHQEAQGGGHYRLSVVSEQFVGKTTLTRHRMVYSALQDLMKHDIHALNIRAYAPDEI